MKNPKILICESFKYRDFLFKNFTKSLIRSNMIYRGLEEDGQYYAVISIDGYDQYVYLEGLDKEIRDPRFSGRFSDFTIDHLLSEKLPEIDNFDPEEWMTMDHNSKKEEEDYTEEEIVDFLMEDEELVVNTYSHIKSYSHSLSTGVLEALSGVISLEMGDLIDKEKGKLLAALKGVIEQFDKSSDIKDLYMAQYLLFNIINLAKNNWK